MASLMMKLLVILSLIAVGSISFSFGAEFEKLTSKEEKKGKFGYLHSKNHPRRTRNSDEMDSESIEIDNLEAISPQFVDGNFRNIHSPRILTEAETSDSRRAGQPGH
ncbi:uncharacterized protein LOC110618892 [Manihot esculenta]|uniref:Uncharacterized protein n=1 Tax=Manihot esculenta TaxID=3983 RepID=A0A2C9VK35_MANES|nr:uncharacterized protein LOC110618892 [Manihot esculenta]OAY45088.1 hypothetical protein MANES_07G030100v8 [Manihot esculenta]